jgi:arylsulfatase A-like enzyme
MRFSILLLQFYLLSCVQAAAPNFLFIFCDDLTTQAISAYGDKRHLLQTPGLDRLAREGMKFQRCLVTNAICGPMRAVVQTGKYSHLNGFYNNSNSRFDASQDTFPKRLQAAGYRTAVIGKWHLGTDPVGFDHWRILPNQGDYYNPVFNEQGKKATHEGYVTDLITRFSLDWLKQQESSQQPFMLMCQHKAPHREWEPALRHLGHDGDRPYAEPETLFDTFPGRSQAVQQHDMGIEKTFLDRDLKLVPPPRLNAAQKTAWDAYYEPRNQAYHQQKLQGKELLHWRYQRYMHDYLACVKSVDESVQELLSYLEKAGLDKQTCVILSSDQGFYLGEHGWFDKRWIFEESLRTPMLVRWPGVVKPGSEDSHLTSLLDLAQTFLDAAGQQAPADMQGRSLMPLLKGENPAGWRSSHYYHYYEFPAPHHVRPHEGIVTAQHKLIRYYLPGQPDEWELLDSKADPQETRSFHEDPAYASVLESLKKQLVDLRTELHVPAEVPREAFGTKPFTEKPE